MDKRNFQKVFSNQRTQKYFDRHADESKAIRHYEWNIRLSESIYPLLSNFEVALRNSLDRELTTMFGTTDWYLRLAAVPGLSDLNQEITIAKRHIVKRGETIHAAKLVAELTLGFWVRLLNVEYELILWRDLRRAFPFMPKSERKRHNVSAPLNRIRNLRNRIYHNEPIAWNLTTLKKLHDEIYKVLGWLNRDLPVFAKDLDRFDAVLAKAKTDLV